MIADIYLPFCNSETGDYTSLIAEGGIANQPYMTYKVLDLIRLNYKLYIKEQQEAKAKELQMKKARRK